MKRRERRLGHVTGMEEFRNECWLHTHSPTHSQALRPSESLDLPNICSPYFHINCLLSPFLTLHFPQILLHIYSRSKIREVAVKNHNYICRYNNLPTTCFGRDRPSSGWDITSEEKYLLQEQVWGRDVVHKYMGLVVEPVLEQACVRLVCTSVGQAWLGLEALVAGCHNGRLRQSCAAVKGVLSRALTPVRPQAPYICERHLVPPYLFL